MLFVTDWNTGEIYYTFEDRLLNRAKGYTRGMGHTGEDNPGLTGYPPIAYLANENGEVVYNPRFGKRISDNVSGLINAQPSNHF